MKCVRWSIAVALGVSLIVTSATSWATVGPGPDPVDSDRERLEIGVILGNAVVSMIDLATLSTEHRGRPWGSISMLIGIGTIGLSISEDAEHASGLAAAGVISLGLGMIAFLKSSGVERSDARDNQNDRFDFGIVVAPQARKTLSTGFGFRMRF